MSKALRSSSTSDEEMTSPVNIFSDESTVSTRYSTSVTFPPFSDLMQLQVGEYVASNPFTVVNEITKQEYDFRVKLYPRGGGHPTKRNLFVTSNGNEKVAVYLQFLPRNVSDERNSFVDATFTLTLIGKQLTPPRFNVEWRSGMRFVPLSETKMAEGQANDFGAHIMQTPLLAPFLGVTDDTYWKKDPVEMKVDVILHKPPPQVTSTRATTTIVSEDSTTAISQPWKPQDVRLLNEDSSNKDSRTIATSHDSEQLRAGRIIVPIFTKLSERRRMYAEGVYPGVEYRILRVIEKGTDDDLFYSKPGVDYELKPIYPLVAQLERQWPVRVNEQDIPIMYTPAMYNVVSAVGSLATAVTGLATAFFISQAISFFYIPSKSMDPTLQVGNVLLVEKVTPRLERLVSGDYFFRPGDVVLFSPPQQLQEIVAKSGGKLNDRDLFVKRIAAVPGDRFAVVDKAGTVQINGQNPAVSRDMCDAEPLKLIQKYIQPSEQIIESGKVVVLGDCSDVSIDSRVWGPLPTENIVGRPIVRLWPLSQFGAVPSLPMAPTLNDAADSWKN